MNRTYRLDDGRQTLVSGGPTTTGCQRSSIGARPCPTGEDLDTLHAAHAIDVTGGMLDENPDLSICPEATRSFPGQPGLILRDTRRHAAVAKVLFRTREREWHAGTDLCRRRTIG